MIPLPACDNVASWRALRVISMSQGPARAWLRAEMNPCLPVDYMMQKVFLVPRGTEEVGGKKVGGEQLIVFG